MSCFLMSVLSASSKILDCDADTCITSPVLEAGIFSCLTINSAPPSCWGFVSISTMNSAASWEQGLWQHTTKYVGSPSCVSIIAVNRRRFYNWNTVFLRMNILDFSLLFCVETTQSCLSITNIQQVSADKKILGYR